MMQKLVLQQTQPLMPDNTNILLNSTSEVNVTEQQENNEAKKLTTASTYFLLVCSQTSTFQRIEVYNIWLYCHYIFS